MNKGIVTHWNDDRGFGFIKRDDGAPDVFVHVSGIVGQSSDALPAGARVTFDVEISQRNGKPAAVNVRVL